MLSQPKNNPFLRVYRPVEGIRPEDYKRVVQIAADLGYLSLDETHVPNRVTQLGSGETRSVFARFDKPETIDLSKIAEDMVQSLPESSRASLILNNTPFQTHQLLPHRPELSVLALAGAAMLRKELPAIESSFYTSLALPTKPQNPNYKPGMIVADNLPPEEAQFVAATFNALQSMPPTFELGPTVVEYGYGKRVDGRLSATDHSV